MDNPTRARHERTREHLTPEEAVKLSEASKEPGVSRNPERDYCLLLLMFRHGLRVMEICSLIKEKVLHIKRLKSCASGDHPMFNLTVNRAPSKRGWPNARKCIHTATRSL
jgi:integrase